MLTRSTIIENIALGFLGGIVLCGSTQWFFYGKEILPAFVVFVIVVGYFGRHLATYKERFLASFLTFAVAGLMFWVYALIKTHAIGRVPIYFMALSLTALMAIGGVVNLAVAAVSGARRVE